MAHAHISMVAMAASAAIVLVPKAGLAAEATFQAEQAISQAQEVRAIVHACEDLRQALVSRAMGQRDTVFHFGYDFNQRDGYILNSPLNLYIRYMRDELDLSRAEFHRLAHAAPPSLHACQSAAEQYARKLDCLASMAMGNDVRGMERCSETYRAYEDPYRYYGGRPN